MDIFRPDVVVVLNGGVLDNGELKQDTKNRVDRGLQIAHTFENVGHIAMVGKNAEQMRDYASSLSPALDTKIIIDNESGDTMGNAHYFKKNYLEPNNWRQLALVTADFHMPRSLWTFKRILGKEYLTVPFESDTNYDRQKMLKLRTLEIGYWAVSATLLAFVKPEQDDRREKVIRTVSSRYGGKNPLQRIIGAFDKKTDIRT